MTGTEYVDYISNLFDSMLSNFEISDSNIMIIKHYNTFELTSDYINKLADSHEKASFLYHSFDAGDMLGAYEPFIDWIRQLYYDNPEETLDEFFENSNVYLLHRPIFQSYFETGVCQRTEELLFGEREFEHEKFIDEIVDMLCRLSSKKSLFLVFDKLHAAGNSTMNVVQKLLNKKCGKSIAIVATFNENAVKLSYMKNTWRALLEKFDEHDCVIDWTLNTIPLDSDYHSVFKFDNNKIAEYCKKVNNMYQMLAFEQAAYYLEILYHKFEIEKVHVVSEYKFSFLEMYAQISMYLDKTSDALLYCNGMRSLTESEKNLEWEYKYYYLAARIQMYSFEKENATKYVNRCIEVSKLMDDDFCLFKAELLHYMTEFYGWRNMWVHGDECEIDDGLISKAEKYGYHNHIAHIYVFSCDNIPERFEHIDKIDESLARSNQGIRIAEHIGNEQLLISAYKKNVMMASTNGFYDVANRFHEKCFAIATKKHDFTEEAGMYNGMGYNCSTMEKYIKANEYYNKALLLYIQLNDIDHINETIYNMAVNAILAEEYAVAESYLATCLKVIEITKVNSVQVCNITKIYGLKAYCCYKLNIIYRCKIDMQYVEQFLGHIIPLEDADHYSAHLWDDDLFLYYFVNALLSEQVNELDEAVAYLEKAKKYVLRAKGSMFFNYTPYCVEYARICRKLGYDQKAEEILKACLEYCESKGYVYKKNIVKAQLEGKTYNGMKWNLPFKGTSLDDIIKMAVRAGVNIDYRDQKNQINFVGIWQKLTNNQDDSVERMIENAVSTLKNTNNFDEFMFIRIEDGVPVMKYNDARYDMPDEKIKYMVDYFNKNRSEFAITRLDRGYSEHKTFIDKVFGFNSINTLICAPIFVNEQLSCLFISCVLINEDWNYMQKKYKFDGNDLAILMMLFRQLFDAIERMEAQNKIKSINKELKVVNDKLKQMSVKDNLTGLYNRQGFKEELDALVQSNMKLRTQFTISFLYADLDNFKYYNDTFGHHIGDLILKEFSALISDICKGRGYAVRYGGDEFLLVLYSNGREEIEEAAKLIYSKLEAEQGFVKKISDTLNKEIEIPKERYVSCSVGISNTVIGPDDDPREKIDQTLKHADKMMYYVKRTTKHRYVFYDDVKTEDN